MGRDKPAFPCAPRRGWKMRLWAWYVGVDGPKSTAAALDRSQVPILACVGGNGGGKSLAAVYTVLPVLAGMAWECHNPDHLHTHGTTCASRRYLSSEPSETCDCATTWTRTAGQTVVELVAEGGTTTGHRRVLSTVELRDLIDTDEPSPYYERLRSFVQLLGVEHADVLMDEVTGVASSRAHQSMPVQVENLIQQLRRRDARLIWTTPDYGNADNRIRSVTRAVVFCKGLGMERSRIGGGIWRGASLFRWTMYDASEFDQFTVGKREKLQPISRQWFYRPGHIVERAYDTLAAVSQLGAAAEGGMCMSCGGSRSRPSCSCPPDPDRLPPGVTEEVTPAGSRKRKFTAAAAVQALADVNG